MVMLTCLGKVLLCRPGTSKASGLPELRGGASGTLAGVRETPPPPLQRGGFQQPHGGLLQPQRQGSVKFVFTALIYEWEISITEKRETKGTTRDSIEHAV